MNKFLMFSYGANTNYDHMAIKCPGAIKVGKADLDNHIFKFRRHATVEERQGSVVTGVLWEISDAHLDRLDMYESYPLYYNRSVVRVRPQYYTLSERQHKIISKYSRINDRYVDAILYSLIDKSVESMPDREYFNICYEGYVENIMDLSVLTKSLENCTLFRTFDKKGIFV